MQVRVKRLHPHVRLPEYAYPGDAGMDIFTPERVMVPAHGRAIVSAGIALEIPDGYAGFIWSKSGLMAHHGISLTPGVIDSSYRGELMLVLENTSDADYTFEAGDKVAQMLIQSFTRAELAEVEELTSTERGEARFGSSGK